MKKVEGWADFGSQIGSLLLPVIEIWSNSHVRRSETFTARLFAATTGAFTVALPTASRVFAKEASEEITIASYIGALGENPLGIGLLSLAWLFAVFTSAVIVARSLQKASLLVLYVVTVVLWAGLTSVITPLDEEASMDQLVEHHLVEHHREERE